MFAQYNFQWSVISDHWPTLLAGAWIDLSASLIGFSFACALGLVLAMARRTPWAAVRGAAYAVVEASRGIPPYVLLLWVHFGLSRFVGIAFTPMQSIVAVLAFTGAGYAAEIFRSGIAAVDDGQTEAARALGLTRRDTYVHVILPQSLRLVVAPLGNVLVGILKTATLMGVIAIPDMLHRAQGINMNYFAPFEAFTAVLLVFVAMVFTLSFFFLAIERALEHP